MLWKELKAGDHIKIASWPNEFLDSSTFHEETEEVYRHLIESQRVLKVDRLEANQFPWVEFVRVVDGVEEYHSLLLNHGGIERA